MKWMQSVSLKNPPKQGEPQRNLHLMLSMTGTFPANKQSPLLIQHRGGKCIHVFKDSSNRPKDGQPLAVHYGCALSRPKFQLWPNGTLMYTRHGMCVKPTGPVTDGVRVGVFSSCSVTDKWSWTAQGSLQYKKKMCLRPETGGANPSDNVKLVLNSSCNEPQNVFQFVATSGWYLYIETSLPRERNDAARLISPSTTESKSCLSFFYCMYGADVGKLQVYVKSGGKMGLPVWSRSGNYGDKWYQVQMAVNNQTASYQYVIEGVRGIGVWGDIAIDDISLMDSCTAENQPSKPTSVLLSNNGSKKVTTTFTVSTTPAILPSQTTYWSEDKGTTDDSSRIIIIATTMGAGIFLCIVLIVLLIRYKRRNRAPQLSTPVNIPLMVATPQESLPIDQESYYETVARVDREFYDDVATNANKSEDISAEGRALLCDWVGVPSNVDKTSDYETPVENEQHEPGNETVARVDREFYNDVATNGNESEDTSAEGRTSDHEEVGIPANAHKASGHTELDKRPDTLKRGATGDGDSDDGHVIPAPEEPQDETPGKNETYEEPKISPENPGYAELDKNRLQGRNTTEDGTYQKLVKRDSDYVIPAHERRESYEDIRMGRNLPGYTELDLSKRETEESQRSAYQKLVKT